MRPRLMQKGVQNMLVPASPYISILQHSAKGQLWHKHVAGVPVKWARVNAYSRLWNMPSDNSSADISSLIWLQSMLQLLVSERGFSLTFGPKNWSSLKRGVLKGESTDLRSTSFIRGVLYETECQEWFVGHCWSVVGFTYSRINKKNKNDATHKIAYLYFNIWVPFLIFWFFYYLWNDEYLKK